MKKCIYTSQYDVAFAFCLARVRSCTLPSANPHAPCLARISTFFCGRNKVW